MKDLGDDQVAPAVRKVLAGEASLPGTLVARLVEEFRDREHRRIGIAPEQAARLTGREWDVLELMREGLSTNEIGARLFVSPTTVRTHVSSVLKKLQVADRERGGATAGSLEPSAAVRGGELGDLRERIVAGTSWRGKREVGDDELVDAKGVVFGKDLAAPLRRADHRGHRQLARCGCRRAPTRPRS